ncbi:MAG: SEL1-like repeat protein [Cyanobacteria bacterium REEB67]|nr:SEL1-like repeat protein [Cyanobacteria bacterium REEB67]
MHDSSATPKPTPEAPKPLTPSAEMEQGIKALKERHYHVAARHFELAALAGLVEAQYELGQLFEKGMGVRTDSVRARNLYKKAATQNHLEATEKMAEYVAEGIGGPKHLDEAREWREKAQSIKEQKAK